MANPKIVFSESGLSVGVNGYHNWAEHTYQRLKQAAKDDAEYFLNLYKVVKKRRKRNAQNATKRSVKIRRVFKVTNVTDNSFTIQ